MEQDKLVERVRAIWEKQGFSFEGESPHFTASNEESFSVSVFSSEDYSREDVREMASESDHVFVDEGHEEVDVRKSVIREREETQYDLPSFEIIGDIAIINDLAGRDEEKAVEGIKDNHPFVETVMLKEEPLQGEFRVGEYRKLTGDKTETVHTEHGCTFKVDPTRVYYSERYSSERERVISQIKPGERVLVMFAGVGPFAVMAAKQRDPEEVVAVEKNPVAADYLEENIEMNSVSDTVSSIKGDVREVMENLGEFDRIIMPLPGAANRFLDLASEHLSSEGHIHYYRFVEGDYMEFIETELEELGLDLDALEAYNAGEKSPSEDRVCFNLARK